MIFQDRLYNGKVSNKTSYIIKEIIYNTEESEKVIIISKEVEMVNVYKVSYQDIYLMQVFKNKIVLILCIIRKINSYIWKRKIPRT